MAAFDLMREVAIQGVQLNDGWGCEKRSVGDEEFNLFGRMLVDSSRSPGFDPDTVGAEYDGAGLKLLHLEGGGWRTQSSKSALVTRKLRPV